MGFLKKLTRPISKVLDKIVPNEIKPALPFLSAAAPFLLPAGIAGGSGISALLRRGALTGGINIASQLAQEGSEGDFSGLSALLAAGTGALTAPGASSTLEQFRSPVGEFDPARTFLQKGKDMGITGLQKASKFLTTSGEALRSPGFNKATAEAALFPVTQATMDLGIAETRRTAKDLANDALNSLPEGATDADRALAIRQFMEAAGYFSEDEIVDTITASGYADGGRVGFDNGGGVITEKEQKLIDLADYFMERGMSESEAYEAAAKQLYAYGGRVKLSKGGDPDFSGIKGAVVAVDENLKADRAGDFFKLREEAIMKGDDDKIKEIESDFFKEFGFVMPKMAKDGGLMDLGGKEMDLRGGGFVPIGKKEKADDVPARLSKNEFVMTADAVRGAGGGDINKGAKRMYETMNRLEARV